MDLAGCIIKDSNGKVLLMHRSSAKRTQWEIPGGGVDEGEIPEQAAIRELKEELDVRVSVVRQIGSKSFREDDVDYAYYWFEATIQDGTPRLTGADGGIHDDIGHFSIPDMREMFDSLSANTKNFVEAIEKKEITLQDS